MLKSERGMSRLELVITIAVIMSILACTIFLAIGENGLSFLPENKEEVNNINENVENNVDNSVNENNEESQENEIILEEEKIANEIENIIDNIT